MSVIALYSFIPSPLPSTLLLLVTRKSGRVHVSEMKCIISCLPRVPNGSGKICTTFERHAPDTSPTPMSSPVPPDIH